MNDYAVMIYPSANRVYADASVRLLTGELRVFDEAVLGGKITDIAETDIGGVPYVTFTAPDLSEHDVALLSNLSVLYALFEVHDDLLRPVPVHRLDVFDSDLLTIQKYSGKTNELFTKLMLNITVLSTDRPDLTERHTVLDPMCGRGTTLHQAMMYDYDASGMEIDPKDFEEYSRFIRTWLKNKRLKHEADIIPIRREHTHLGKRLDISVGVTKERYKAGDALRLSYVLGDTTKATQFFRPGTFDVIVTDAPYGVRHGSQAGFLSRNPVALLSEAAPGWATLLRKGGALGLSWNTYVAERADLTRVLAAAGLTALNEHPYTNFEHRVDQAITRDILVAKKN